jgi:hypothetical protein
MGIFIIFSSIKEPSSMMQISNKVFRPKFLKKEEKGDRLLFRRLLFRGNKDGKRRKGTFLEHNKEISYLAFKRKGKSDSPFFQQVACPLFSPVLPRVYRLLDLTKTRG